MKRARAPSGSRSSIWEPSRWSSSKAPAALRNGFFLVRVASNASEAWSVELPLIGPANEPVDLTFMVPKYKTTQAVFQRSVKPEGYSAVRVKRLKNKSAKQ